MRCITHPWLFHEYLGFTTPKHKLQLEEHVCLLSLFTIFKVFSLTLKNINLNLNCLNFFYLFILSRAFPTSSIYFLFLESSRVLVISVFFCPLWSLFPISLLPMYVLIYIEISGLFFSDNLELPTLFPDIVQSLTNHR